MTLYKSDQSIPWDEIKAGDSLIASGKVEADAIKNAFKKKKMNRNLYGNLRDLDIRQVKNSAGTSKFWVVKYDPDHALKIKLAKRGLHLPA